MFFWASKTFLQTSGEPGYFRVTFSGKVQLIATISIKKLYLTKNEHIQRNYSFSKTAPVMLIFK